MLESRPTRPATAERNSRGKGEMNDPSKEPNPATGILLMAVAMLMIPSVDGLAKALSASHSPLFISWARYAVACLVVLPIAIARDGVAFLPRRQRGTHLLRTIFLVSSMTCYFLAIVHIPLATAISAFFIGPIIAMVLAVVFLREPLTRQKLISLALGVVGALIIVRPQGGPINPGLLLALAAGAFFALYMIATRLASQQSDPIRTLAFQCLVGTLILTPQAAWTWSWPAASEIWLFAALGICSAVSHLLSITAFRYAQASLLAPLVYLELLGASVIGYLAFDEVPDAAVWVGAGLIILAGILLLRRPPAAGGGAKG